MNFFLFLAIIYFSGVIANVLGMKVYNKFSADPFTPKDVCIVWFSWIFWFLALIAGVINGANWLNNKFKNWIFK